MTSCSTKTFEGHPAKIACGARTSAKRPGCYDGPPGTRNKTSAGRLRGLGLDLRRLLVDDLTRDLAQGLERSLYEPANILPTSELQGL
jgi:hypothetical protein